jgi:hypothetical protein
MQPPAFQFEFFFQNADGTACAVFFITAYVRGLENRDWPEGEEPPPFPPDIDLSDIIILYIRDAFGNEYELSDFPEQMMQVLLQSLKNHRGNYEL